MRPVIFISFLSVIASGCGDLNGGEGRLVAQGRPIYYGEVDDDPAHMAVVAITNGPGSGYFCTGTLIASSYVLTAGHCLDGQSARNVEVFFGSNAYSSGTYRDAAELAVHPNYDGWNILNDIGMIRLATPAPTSVTPIPYLPSRLGLTRADEGAIVDFSGFGVTENRTDGQKLHVERPIDRVCTGPSSCNEIVPHAFGYSQSGGGPCSGDSGGPAFLLRSGTEYVAGITSYGDQRCTDYGVSTTVSDFEPFISRDASTPACRTGPAAGAARAARRPARRSPTATRAAVAAGVAQTAPGDPPRCSSCSWPYSHWSSEATSGKSNLLESFRSGTKKVWPCWMPNPRSWRSSSTRWRRAWTACARCTSSTSRGSRRSSRRWRRPRSTTS